MQTMAGTKRKCYLHEEVFFNDNLTAPGCLVEECSPGVRDVCGFKSWLSHSKDFKNGTWYFFAKRSAFQGENKEMWSVYLLSTVKCDQLGCYINVPAI